MKYGPGVKISPILKTTPKSLPLKTASKGSSCHGGFKYEVHDFRDLDILSQVDCRKKRRLGLGVGTEEGGFYQITGFH